MCSVIRRKFSIGLIVLCAISATAQTAKPKLRVAADGLPSGHATPEGVAADLAKAFINHDVELFRSTCIRVFSKGKSGPKYSRFLAEKEDEIKHEAAQKQPSPGGPKCIMKIFAARHLSRNGPASTGYAFFGFQDIMFVDVGVGLYNGERYLTRTMVIQDEDGKWYVHPCPSCDPLLSFGLNEETASTQDFTAVYDIEK